MVLPEQGESTAGIEEADTGVLKQGSELLREEKEVSRRTDREGQGQGWDEMSRAGISWKAGRDEWSIGEVGD